MTTSGRRFRPLIPLMVFLLSCALLPLAGTPTGEPPKIQDVTSPTILPSTVTSLEQPTRSGPEYENLLVEVERGRVVESNDPSMGQQGYQSFMVPARAEDKVVLVDPAEILYAFAQDDRAYIQTRTDRLVTQFTLAELEKRQSRSGFFRAHRAYLVNLQQVKEVIPYTRNSFSLRLKDVPGTKIPLSKSAERELRALLGY